MTKVPVSAPLQPLRQLWFLLILTGFAAGRAAAQESPMTYGEVPPADLRMTVYEPDTAVTALVLGEVGDMYFNKGDKGYEYALQSHRRIKLLKTKAFDDYSSISIPYYHYEDLEYGQLVKAQTITPDGRIYEVDRKDIFTEKINDRWSRITFTFPRLVEGAVIEYVYRIRSRDIVQPRAWYFQENIPVRLSELHLSNNLPAAFITLFEGGEYLQKVKEDKEGSWLAFGDTRFLFGEKMFRMVNSPPLKEEAFITTMEDYQTRIRLQLKEIVHADGYKEQVLSTWEKAAQDLDQNENFGALYKRKRFFKQLIDDLDPVVNSLNSPREKMEAVYQFITGRVKYNSRDGMFPRRNPDDAYATREASSSELNLMLLAALRNYGLDAYPLLTSTRDHGHLTQGYPIMEQFNYVMALVNLDGEVMLLDATDPHRPVSMPSINALNHFGWVVNPDNPGWISVEMHPCGDTFAGRLDLGADGALKGIIRATFTGYSALGERKTYLDNKTGSYWKNRLDKWLTDPKLDSVGFQRQDDWKGNFINMIYFTAPEAAVAADDFLYFSPIVYSNFRENPFQLNERTYPIDLPYPFIEQYNMTINLPEGYQVEELPENIQFKLPDETGEFKLEVKSLAADKVHIVYAFSLLKTRISPEYYKEVKKMFELLRQKQQDQIVLKKK